MINPEEIYDKSLGGDGEETDDYTAPKNAPDTNAGTCADTCADTSAGTSAGISAGISADTAPDISADTAPDTAPSISANTENCTQDTSVNTCADTNVPAISRTAFPHGNSALDLAQQIQDIRLNMLADTLYYIDQEIIKTFHLNLTPEQKKEFDTLAIRMGLKGLLHKLANIPEDLQGTVELIREVVKLEIQKYLIEPKVVNGNAKPAELQDETQEAERRTISPRWRSPMTHWTIDKTMNFIRFGAVSAGEQTSFEAIYASCKYYCGILDTLKLPYSAHFNGPFPYIEIHGKGDYDNMLLAHLDTVEAQNPKQFTPSLKKDRFNNGWLEGRGSSDMIGSTMIATRALADAHKTFKNVPPMLVVFNEEVAEQPFEGKTTGTNAFIEQAQREGRDLSNLTFIALERTNNPCEKKWYPQEELVGEIADKSRGAMLLRITIYGKAGHGGELKSINLASALPKMQEFIIAEAIKRNPELSQNPGFTNQIIPLQIDAGKENCTTLPNKGYLEMMIRVVPGVDIEKIKASMEEIIKEYGLNYSNEWKCSEPGPQASKDTPALKRLAEAIAQAFGEEHVRFQNKVHASSARIPAGKLGAEGFVWGPASGLDPHGPSERLSIDSISAGGTVLLKYLDLCDKNSKIRMEEDN